MEKQARASEVFKFAISSLVAILFIAPNVLEAQTETAYVIDQLLVGVHAEKTLDSAITKVLATGTQLEVLEREGELARVRDPQGNQGWIDAAYLMTNPPARQMLERLERANSELQRQLATAQNTPPATATPAGQERSDTVDALTKENTELKRKLSTEKINNTKLNEKLNAAEARLGDRPLSAAETELTEMEKTVTKLKRELEQSLQDNKTLKAQNKQPLSAALPKIDREISWPLLVTAIVLLLVAYGAGIYTMDYFNRRRHGGFRV